MSRHDLSRVSYNEVPCIVVDSQGWQQLILEDDTTDCEQQRAEPACLRQGGCSIPPLCSGQANVDTQPCSRYSIMRTTWTIWAISLCPRIKL